MTTKKEQKQPEKVAQKKPISPKKTWIKPECSPVEIQYGMGFKRSVTMDAS